MDGQNGKHWYEIMGSKAACPGRNGLGICVVRVLAMAATASGTGLRIQNKTDWKDRQGGERTCVRPCHNPSTQSGQRRKTTVLVCCV